MVVTAVMVGLVLLVLVLDFHSLIVALEWIDSPLHSVVVGCWGSFCLLCGWWVINKVSKVSRLNRWCSFLSLYFWCSIHFIHRFFR